MKTLSFTNVNNAPITIAGKTYLHGAKMTLSAEVADSSGIKSLLRDGLIVQNGAGASVDAGADAGNGAEDGDKTPTPPPPPLPQATPQMIVDAVNSLEPDVAANWIANGTPSVDAVVAVFNGTATTNRPAINAATNKATRDMIQAAKASGADGGGETAPSDDGNGAGDNGGGDGGTEGDTTSADTTNTPQTPAKADTGDEGTGADAGNKDADKTTPAKKPAKPTKPTSNGKGGNGGKTESF